MRIPNKINKTLKRRLEDCEAHLMFLKEAMLKCNSDLVHYKQVAAELRVLMADPKPKTEFC